MTLEKRRSRDNMNGIPSPPHQNSSKPLSDTMHSFESFNEKFSHALEEPSKILLHVHQV